MLELSVDDADDFDALYAELRGIPGITLDAAPGRMEPGDQGHEIEILTIALSSGAVTSFFGIIKMLLESRGPGFILKIRQGKNRLEITADNVNDALPVIKELLDES